MKVVFQQLDVRTSGRKELVDLTDRIEQVVEESGLKEGMCLITTLHTTSCIIINEHEEGLMQDIVAKLRTDFPNDGKWLHNRIDDNADAHLASSFLGPSKVLPIRDGVLVRGTWQNIFLMELDGPRKRTVLVELLGN